ncbi:MAG: hypothetical protein ACJARO_002313 [Bacteriovoracaceae bacterium]|jgi:hypothetical protein
MNKILMDIKNYLSFTSSRFLFGKKSRVSKKKSTKVTKHNPKTNKNTKKVKVRARKN